MLYVFWSSVMFSSVFGVFLTCLQFIIPFLILVFCYGKIVWMLTRRIDSSLESSGNQTDKFELARTNTIKTFLLVGVGFIICWSSNSVFYLLHNLRYEVNFNGTFTHFAVAMIQLILLYI